MNYTNYKEVDEFLNSFLEKVKLILQNGFVSMYLYGSLALGGFNAESSDLDILIATKSKLSEEVIQKLKDMHSNLQKQKNVWSKRLEVSYMPLSILRKYDPKNNKNPFASPVSEFAITELGQDWILNRWVVREKGVIVDGPDPKTLIDEIPATDVKKVTKDLICDSWSKHVNGPDWMKPKKYQAFTVLTMCRALYSIEKGEVVSKTVAADWAKKNIDTRWLSLIDDALLSQNNLEETDMSETLEFLKYVLDRVCN